MMIRKGTEADLDGVNEGYEELLRHEKEHGAYTVWELGVYPTRNSAKMCIRDSLSLCKNKHENFYDSILHDTGKKGKLQAYEEVLFPFLL